VRPPSGSPPRVPDEDSNLRSIFQSEFATFKQEVLTALEAAKMQHQQQLEELSARHRAKEQQFHAELERLKNVVAQLSGAAESRDRASRASHLIVKGLIEEPNGQSTQQAVSQLFPASDGDTPVPILEATLRIIGHTWTIFRLSERELGCLSADSYGRFSGSRPKRCRSAINLADCKSDHDWPK